MSFIVEDGTGLENSNAFISVADCDTYQSNLSRTDWDILVNAVKELAIIKATMYVNNRYNWNGTKNTRDQALNWPRTNAYDNNNFLIDSDIVPVEVKNATCEYAYLISIDTDLYSSERLVKKEKVSSLEVEYLENQAEVNNFLFIDDILKGLISSSNSSIINLSRD